MVLAVTATTLIQSASVLVALLSALASWMAVKQARDAAQEVRKSESEARLPLLLISRAFSEPGVGPRTMALSIYNAGGIAQDVGVILVGEESRGVAPIDFIRPGETITFGSDVEATGNSRALAFARSADRRQLVWDHDHRRKELAPDDAPMPSWSSVFAAFYPGEDLEDLRPGKLLRGF